MHLGVFYFPVDYGIDISELARALEDRGYESLFLPEHTHIPTSRRTPWPGGPSCPGATGILTIRLSRCPSLRL